MVRNKNDMKNKLIHPFKTKLLELDRIGTSGVKRLTNEHLLTVVIDLLNSERQVVGKGLIAELCKRFSRCGS